MKKLHLSIIVIAVAAVAAGAALVAVSWPGMKGAKVVDEKQAVCDQRIAAFRESRRALAAVDATGGQGGLEGDPALAEYVSRLEDSNARVLAGLGDSCPPANSEMEMAEVRRMMEDVSGMSEQAVDIGVARLAGPDEAAQEILTKALEEAVVSVDETPGTIRAILEAAAKERALSTALDADSTRRAEFERTIAKIEQKQAEMRATLDAQRQAQQGEEIFNNVVTGAAIVGTAVACIVTGGVVCVAAAASIGAVATNVAASSITPANPAEQALLNTVKQITRDPLGWLLQACSTIRL